MLNCLVAQFYLTIFPTDKILFSMATEAYILFLALKNKRLETKSDVKPEIIGKDDSEFITCSLPILVRQNSYKCRCSFLRLTITIS